MRIKTRMRRRKLPRKPSLQLQPRSVGRQLPPRQLLSRQRRSKLTARMGTRQMQGLSQRRPCQARRQLPQKLSGQGGDPSMHEPHPLLPPRAGAVTGLALLLKVDALVFSTTNVHARQCCRGVCPA